MSGNGDSQQENQTQVCLGGVGLPGVASGLLRTLGFISEVRGSLVAQR